MKEKHNHLQKYEEVIMVYFQTKVLLIMWKRNELILEYGLDKNRAVEKCFHGTN